MEEQAMKHRPILFSTDMVQAILEGRKTQTRRVVKPQSNANVIDFGHEWERGEFFARCPYGQPGDVLWVRETWAPLGDYPKCNYTFMYKADVEQNYSKWKPSIHMPREAARLFLRIKSVRVERLQEITCQDVFAEGLESGHDSKFITLWESINGHESWEANPWVWVVEFERISKEEAGL
jgi:hypothetical protein